MHKEDVTMAEKYVVYWSGTGNTSEMANIIGEGIASAGSKEKVVSVSEVSADDLKDEISFALGCPSMGCEELEEIEMEPFVAKVETFAAGKQIALFGSFGWGDGEWMRNWEERLTNAGATIIQGEGVICLESPDEEIKTKLVELGKKIAEL